MDNSDDDRDAIHVCPDSQKPDDTLSSPPTNPITTNLSSASPKPLLTSNKGQLPFPTTLPSFKPLLLDPSRLLAAGKANKNVLRDQQGHDPFRICSRFLPKHMLDIIVSHTNKYAQKNLAGEGRPWEDTDRNEIQCFIVISIYMGIFTCPRLEDYWSSNPNTPNFFFTAYMTLLRFQQLKRYLHICDIDGDNGKEYFFNKIEPLFSHFVSVSKHLWIPSSNVSCDEMMVINYGRSAETVRMKNKPIGSGFKIWALCDSGYIFEAIPHSNRDPWSHFLSYKNILPHSAAVVARLVESLPRSQPYMNDGKSKMYAVYMDNLFSTPKLFSLLRDDDIGAVGTVRSNAKGFPKCLAVRGGRDKKMDWNTLGAALCEDGKVLALTWIDNGAVQMLTTIHNVGLDHTVERKRKRPRLTSTNGKGVRQVFENEAVKTLPIPNVGNDYNYNMGGVDIADQLRSSYTSHQTTLRTWVCLFFWIIDSSLSNAFFLMASLDSSWANKHKEF